MCTIITIKDQNIRNCGELAALVGKELVDKYHEESWEEGRCLCGIRDLEDMAREMGYVQFALHGDVQWIPQAHILDIITNADVEKFAQWADVDRGAFLLGQLDPPSSILFLDIDGVLNNTRMQMPANGPTPIDPQAVQHVRQLLDEFDDLKIVVSSAKRIGLALGGLRELLSSLPPERIIDSTPVHTSMHSQRGGEIAQWLNGHPEVERFVILDDNNDMSNLHYYLVRTHPAEGLQAAHLDKCRILLGKEI